MFVCQYEDSATSPEHWGFFCCRAGEEGADALEQEIPQGISLRNTFSICLHPSPV